MVNQLLYAGRWKESSLIMKNTKLEVIAGNPYGRVNVQLTFVIWRIRETATASTKRQRMWLYGLRKLAVVKPEILWFQLKLIMKWIYSFCFLFHLPCRSLPPGPPCIWWGARSILVHFTFIASFSFILHIQQSHQPAQPWPQQPIVQPQQQQPHRHNNNWPREWCNRMRMMTTTMPLKRIWFTCIVSCVCRDHLTSESDVHAPRTSKTESGFFVFIFILIFIFFPKRKWKNWQR